MAEVDYDNKSEDLFGSTNVRRITHYIQRLREQNKEVYEPSDFYPYDALNYGLYDLIDEYLDGLPNDREILMLDLGCGYGIEPRRSAVKKPNLKIIATDISPPFIQVMNTINSMCGLQNRIEGKVLDCSSEEVYTTNPPLDALFTTGTLLFVRDKAALFRNFNKACKLGARVYIDDYIINAGVTISAKEQESLDGLGFQGYTPIAEYIQALQDAGFRLLKFKDQSVPVSRKVFEWANTYLAQKDEILALGQDVWDARPSFYINKFSLTLMHKVEQTFEEAAQKYPLLLAERGEEEFRSRLNAPEVLVYCSFILVKEREI